MGALGLCNNSRKKGANRFQLPHSPVSLAVFLTLEDAIRVAWERIHGEPRPEFDPKTALEVDFTAELHEVLRNEILEEGDVEGFTKEVFHGVIRAEVKNFDGTRKSKRPDLIVELVSRRNVIPTQDGIFIETKLIDGSSKSKHLYCDHGITRFTDGDYAWAMTEALMVAYSRDHRSPSVALEQPFKDRAGIIKMKGKLTDCTAPAPKPPVAISSHRRDFKLRNGKKASAITLRHLWLQRPKSL